MTLLTPSCRLYLAVIYRCARITALRLSCRVSVCGSHRPPAHPPILSFRLPPPPFPLLASLSGLPAEAKGGRHARGDAPTRATLFADAALARITIVHRLTSAAKLSLLRPDVMPACQPSVLYRCHATCISITPAAVLLTPKRRA